MEEVNSWVDMALLQGEEKMGWEEAVRVPPLSREVKSQCGESREPTGIDDGMK